MIVSSLTGAVLEEEVEISARNTTVSQLGPDRLMHIDKFSPISMEVVQDLHQA